MKRLRWVLMVVPSLAFACVALAAMGAGATLSPGQEFIYSGTAEWKQSVTGHPEATLSSPVQISALVTQAVPGDGCTVVLMRSGQPTMAGQAAMPPVADVATARFGADLRPVLGPSRGNLGGSISALLRLVTVPFAPREGLQVGQTWTASESLSVLMPKRLDLVYTVSRKTSVGGRDCLKVDKKVAQMLPVTADLGPMKYALTDYRGTLCVDATSNQVVSDEWQASVRQTYEERESLLNLKIAVKLEQTRQLTTEELASRAAQAEALDKLQATVFSYRPNSDTARWADESTRLLTAFRERFPTTPYAQALVPLEGYVRMTRDRTEKDARRQAMRGGPAPEFKVKSLDGEEQTLGAYRGKLILLNFFASW